MRRGHGSTKVPGVRLRPVAPTTSKTSASSTLQQPAWVQSSIPDDVDNSDVLSSCKKPFVGVVVCASGVSDKVNLFQQAVQLGAQTSSDLTDRVTHLICEAPGSAKYAYCVEHGIPIMQPSWINDSYVKWLSGETVDVNSSIDDHHLPALKSVILCITAIEDIKKRKEIHKLVKKHGGTYIDVLSKDSHLTHLLCGPDRGEKVDERGFTPKMQFVDKANKSGSMKTRMVWEEWLWDCLEFNGLLDVKPYSVTGPKPQRRFMRESSPLIKPITSSAEPLSRQNSIPPPLSITALVNSADAEEIALVKRLPETTARLWGGLLKQRGFEVKDGKLSRSPSKVQTSKSISLEEKPPSPIPARQPLYKGDSESTLLESSLSAAFKRTKSFAVKTSVDENSRSSLQRIHSTTASVLAPSTSSLFGTPSVASFAPVKDVNQIPDGERNLFTGFRFRALGDANGPKLAQAVELRGGTIYTEPDEDVNFIIVRLASGGEFYRNESSESERSKYRTECWIEQCIFEERICAAGDHPAFVPLRIPTPIPGSEKLKLHVSGLSAPEKTPTVRLIKAIGATITDQLSRRNTHLLCPCGSGPKFTKAQEWGIPVMDLNWLYAMVKIGEVPDVSEYLVTSTPSSKEISGGATGITDITNSEFIQGSSKGKASDKSSELSRSSGASFPAQASFMDSDVNQSWTPNDLLSEPVDQPPLSPRKMSASLLTTRPSTPSSSRRMATEEVIENDLSGILPTRKQESQLMRIPSSTTPSPLKIPVDHEIAATSPSTLSGDSTNVLKDAITTLLGKRQSSDDNDVPAQIRRNGKRSKPPPRAKSKQESFSRTTSTDNMSRHGSTSDYLLFIPDSKLPSIEPETTDDSMRVTYEDPSQQDEQRRLLNLINNEHVEQELEAKPGRKGKNLVRRVSKVAEAHN